MTQVGTCARGLKAAMALRERKRSKGEWSNPPLPVEQSLPNERLKFGNHKIGQMANGRTLFPAEPSHTYEMPLITGWQLIGGSKARAV